jgi:hypothetical protein
MSRKKTTAETSPQINGQVVFVDRLQLTGKPPYAIAEVTRPLLCAFLHSQPSDGNLFFGRLSEDLSMNARVMIKEAACKYADLLPLWRKFALEWVGVACPIPRGMPGYNEWDLNKYDVLYRAPVDIGWAKELIFTGIGARFVVPPHGRLLSFAEFSDRYGQPVDIYLRRQLEDKTDTVHRALQACCSEVVEADLTVIDPQTMAVSRCRCVGLSHLDYRDWLLPGGLQYLST